MKKQIYLNGPDGNAYALMAYGSKIASSLGWDWYAIREDMMSGDYEHLKEVFIKHFGEFYEFYDEEDDS